MKPILLNNYRIIKNKLGYSIQRQFNYSPRRPDYLPQAISYSTIFGPTDSLEECHAQKDLLMWQKEEEVLEEFSL